jgi:iron complex outermembrane receptor protein
VGYGTVKKKDLTGAVTVLTSEDFNKGPVTSADQMITGKVAGFTSY